MPIAPNGWESQGVATAGSQSGLRKWRCGVETRLVPLMGPQALKELVRAAGVLELQTEEKLDRAAVRRSFRRAVRTSHPDKSGGSVEVFNEVMWAYLTLNRYFDNKEHNGEATDAKGSTFHQPLSVVDMLYSEQDGAYFFQCRCGDVVEVATVALALEVKTYTCETCSLGYTVQQE